MILSKIKSFGLQHEKKSAAARVEAGRKISLGKWETPYHFLRPCKCIIRYVSDYNSFNQLVQVYFFMYKFLARGKKGDGKGSNLLECVFTVLAEMNMSIEIAHPSNSPKQAALQLVIELVRAGKLSPLQGDASNMISLYEQFKTHFEMDKQKNASDSAIS